MPKRSTSDPDNVADMTPPLVATMPYHVAEVTPLDGYRLHVRFLDGTSGEVDMSLMLKSFRSGVFAVLADPIKFADVFVNYGAVSWPSELDLAPDAMHDQLKKHGKWTIKPFD